MPFLGHQDIRTTRATGEHIDLVPLHQFAMGRSIPLRSNRSFFSLFGEILAGLETPLFPRGGGGGGGLKKHSWSLVLTAIVPSAS